jgi:type I restriction enzyme S subunit
MAETKSLHVPAAYGEPPDGWTWSRLDDVSEGVFDCPHSTPKLTDTGPFVVRTQDIITGVFRADQAGRVSEETYAERITRVTPSRGDLLYSREGTYFGIAAEVPAKTRVCLGQRMVLIRPDERRLDFSFLCHWLNSPIMAAHIHGYRDGTVAERLNLPTIRALPILIPPLAEQKAIAAVLGALDDKIELNRRMNATLEAMARALFQSWFVDFDPVRAKLDGRPPAALDPATAALFPEHLEDSPLGHIPKGWTAQRLPDAIEVNPRRTLKSGTIAPYLDMKNLPTHGHSADEVIAREFSSGTKFQNGDSLLARITPCLENGKTGYVDFLEDGQVGWGSTEYIVLSPKPPLPPQFGYLLARSDALRTHAIQNMTGTSGRQRVPSECFHNFWLAVPPPDIARRFDELTAPLMAKIKANSNESRTLATLRDTLLPKLLSGELSVADGSYSKFSNSSKSTETNP